MIDAIRAISIHQDCGFSPVEDVKVTTANSLGHF